MITLEYLRSFRLGGYAIFDFVTAYLGIYLLAPILSRIVGVLVRPPTRAQWMWLTLPLSVVIHLLVSRSTPLTELALDPSRGYLLKFILLGMLYLGLHHPIL